MGRLVLPTAVNHPRSTPTRLSDVVGFLDLRNRSVRLDRPRGSRLRPMLAKKATGCRRRRVTRCALGRCQLRRILAADPNRILTSLNLTLRPAQRRTRIENRTLAGATMADVLAVPVSSEAQKLRCHRSTV